MPSLNAIKTYRRKSCYHVYNRGINKNNIFFRDNDYWAYRQIVRRALKKYHPEIEIRVFALIPSHYHFLLYQEQERSMTTFMRSVSASYSRYIRDKYPRFGYLYQGVYRAILIEGDQHYEDVEKYILNNPLEAGLPSWKHVGYKI